MCIVTLKFVFVKLLLFIDQFVQKYEFKWFVSEEKTLYCIFNSEFLKVYVH